MKNLILGIHISVSQVTTQDIEHIAVPMVQSKVQQCFIILHNYGREGTSHTPANVELPRQSINGVGTIGEMGTGTPMKISALLHHLQTEQDTDGKRNMH